MVYLFFDLEFASSVNGSKICEFGYVTTNEKFDILKRDNLIINPNIYTYEWDRRVVRTILTREKSVYEQSSPFNMYYKKIKELILNSDFVFGYAIVNDAKALNDDCKRYKLPYLTYDFYDVGAIYKEYSNSKKDISLSNLLKDLSIEGDQNEHDAESDAYNTMLNLKEILKRLNLPLTDVLAICGDRVKDHTENGFIQSILEIQKRKYESFIKNKNGDGTNKVLKNSINRDRLDEFIDNVKPRSHQNYLKDMKICISDNYYYNHYKESLNLIQLITNASGKYIRRASQSNIYVIYDEVDENNQALVDEKLPHVLEANENGSSIEIITIEELLNKLKIDSTTLSNLPIPSFDFLLEDKAIIKPFNDKKLISSARKYLNSLNENSNEEENVSDDSETLGSLLPKFFDQ